MEWGEGGFSFAFFYFLFLLLLLILNSCCTLRSFISPFFPFFSSIRLLLSKGKNDRNWARGMWEEKEEREKGRVGKNDNTPFSLPSTPPSDTRTPSRGI